MQTAVLAAARIAAPQEVFLGKQPEARFVTTARRMW